MKKVLFIICCMLAVLDVNAQDKKIAIASATATSTEPGNEATKAIDGKTNTIWHSAYSNEATKFPVKFTITLKEATHVDYVRYTPRQDGNTNGNWNVVHVAYCSTTTGNNFTTVGQFSLNGTSATSDLWLTEEGVTCGKIQFTISSGDGEFASASEIGAYAIDNSVSEVYAKYFTDKIYTQLKPEVTSNEGIENETLKTLVGNLLKDATNYKKFRVGEYEPYLSTETLINTLKVSSYYNNYENPTGIYLKAGESCVIAVSGIKSQYPVGLTIKNWVENENSSSYTLRNGINQITASTEGNVFVHYYTDDFENAPNIKVHFINAPVQGYWDQATMTNEDWAELLKGRSASDNTILITRSEHAQLAYPVSAWLKHCPKDIDSTMTLYQQVQWAQRNILGLEKYGRQVKNRQLYYATTYGFMAAGGEGAYCNVNSLDAIMVPDSKKFDFWGVGHEWGHNNQVTTGFKWSGCGETTNNIYASWGQIHFTGTPSYLRLEDETSGVGEYKGMRGGRMQTYFEEGLRKGVAWQLQDGPDYYNATPETKSVPEINAEGYMTGNMVTTTSRNYDHFVKLAPFWQLNLWGTLAGKCPDIIPMVIESIRSTKNYTSYHNSNGKKQINWMKLACDSAKIDLLPFFERAGMLRPIHAYIEDYSPGWNIITEEMIANLKAHVKEQGYPAFTEEINYINGHNYHIYRDCLKLEVPEALGEGCKLNGTKMNVQHNAVKNAVAFETYNVDDELIRITMYGLGSDDQHSYTQVLFPASQDAKLNSAYIMAVGYDGTRIKIYERGEAKENFYALLEKAKTYAKRIDTTGRKIGFIKAEYATDFTATVEKIDSMLEQSNERERPYGTWAKELEEAIQTLDGSYIPLTPDRFYSIAASTKANHHIGNTTDGLNTNEYQGNEMPRSLRWKFIPTDTAGMYYLQQHTTGHYISSANNGERAKAVSRNIEDAVAFSVQIVAPGELYIHRADDKTVRLYLNSSSVYVGRQNGDNAKWLITMEEEPEADNMLALPETSTDEQLTVYYLINANNGEYAYSYEAKSRDKGRIATGVYDEPYALEYWFYFKQGEQEGTYSIYSYKTGNPVVEEDDKLYINKKADTAPQFTIAPDAEGLGLIISSGEEYWYTLMGNVAEVIALDTAKQTPWKLQRVRTISLNNEPLESIILSATEATLFEGDSVSLTVETLPTFASEHSVTWSSSDPTVATVDETGEVKAHAAGKAIITATACDGGGAMSTCEVTVLKKDTGIDNAEASVLSVQSRDGAIIINGLEEGSQVSVYSAMGTLMTTTTATNGSAIITTGLSKGNIAIVKVGAQCIKVQMR